MVFSAVLRLKHYITTSEKAAINKNLSSVSVLYLKEKSQILSFFFFCFIFMGVQMFKLG